MKNSPNQIPLNFDAPDTNEGSISDETSQNPEIDLTSAIDFSFSERLLEKKMVKDKEIDSQVLARVKHIYG